MMINNRSKMLKKITCMVKRLMLKEFIKWTRNKRSWRMTSRVRAKMSFLRKITLMVLAKNKANKTK